jgi:hypothetical protein
LLRTNITINRIREKAAFSICLKGLKSLYFRIRATDTSSLEISQHDGINYVRAIAVIVARVITAVVVPVWAKGMRKSDIFSVSITVSTFMKKY